MHFCSSSSSSSNSSSSRRTVVVVVEVSLCSQESLLLLPLLLLLMLMLLLSLFCCMVTHGQTPAVVPPPPTATKVVPLFRVKDKRTIEEVQAVRDHSALLTCYGRFTVILDFVGRIFKRKRHNELESDSRSNIAMLATTRGLVGDEAIPCTAVLGAGSRGCTTPNTAVTGR